MYVSIPLIGLLLGTAMFTEVPSFHPQLFSFSSFSCALTHLHLIHHQLQTRSDHSELTRLFTSVVATSTDLPLSLNLPLYRLAHSDSTKEISVRGPVSDRTPLNMTYIDTTNDRQSNGASTLLFLRILVFHWHHRPFTLLPPTYIATLERTLQLW
jgi:hypothetical protein